MKKTLSTLLCASMIFAISACGKTEKLNYKDYKVNNYTFNLPNIYDYNDLIEVKAEPNCIAVFTDKDGKLPELWIYEDDVENVSMKDYIHNNDKFWCFDEIEIYVKDNNYLARTTFDEDWYGRAFKNEAYYRSESGNKIVWFDFAYDWSSDADTKHAYVLEIAEHLGF